jgi:hypothetical protein
MSREPCTAWVSLTIPFTGARSRILVSSRSAPAVGRTTAVAVANRSGSGSGSGGAEATANTSVVEKQKLASTGFNLLLVIQLVLKLGILIRELLPMVEI